MWNEAHPEAEVVRRFVLAINAHDPAALDALMSEEHEFVDATGAVHSGRGTMQQGWVQYLKAFPDYRIDVQESLGQGETVALFGWAAGTFAGGTGEARGFRIPAAWKAVVRGGRVARWSVYCDVEPVLRSMGQGRP